MQLVVRRRQRRHGDDAGVASEADDVTSAHSRWMHNQLYIRFGNVA